ncbi:MAG: CUAEP/CCAEP-tail radical SAM (seleno)protein, partial [Candidatus Acidiferrales bacterium]
MNVVLISTYEMGRQPFGLASPAAWLRRTGAEVTCLDLSRQPLDEAAVRAADLVAFYVPMHTATRLAAQLIEPVRRINSRAHLCFYGLYAPVNEAYLRKLGVQTILGGEFEQGLVALLQRLSRGGPQCSPVFGAEQTEGRHRGPLLGETAPQQPEPVASLARQKFAVPDRAGLPRLAHYAHLVMPGGDHRTVGYTEASRGCKHLCRHCPIVPVYHGVFRIVQ